MKKCFTALSDVALATASLIDFMAESSLCLLAGTVGLGLGLLCWYIAMRCFWSVIGALFA